MLQAGTIRKSAPRIHFFITTSTKRTPPAPGAYPTTQPSCWLSRTGRQQASGGELLRLVADPGFVALLFGPIPDPALPVVTELTRLRKLFP